MKKKVLIIMPSMFIGGAERSLLGLLENFDYSAYDVSLFLYRHEGEFLKYIPDKVNLLPEMPEYKTFDVSVKSLLLSSKWMFGIARIAAKAAMRLHTKLTKEKQGVWMSMQYISHYLQPLLPNIPGEYDLGIMYLGIAETLINKVNAKRKITWNHTDYDILFPNKEMDLNTYKCVDALVSVSEQCTEKVKKYYPELKDKAITIENSIAVNTLLEEAEESITDFPDDGSIRFLSVGRFSDAKNFDNVPDICRRIRSEGYDIKWYLIGYGSDEALIRQRIKDAGVEDYVIILGKKNNPYSYMKQCDYYLQPSRYEGKCVSVREAQILRKPVIITRYATSGSQLIENVDGVIVPMDNEGCAEGIIRFLNNEILKNSIIQNCAERDYSNASEIKKICELVVDSSECGILSRSL